MFPKRIGEKFMLKKSRAFLLVTILITKHIRCLILSHIKKFEVEMYYFMRMEMKDIRWIVMMNGKSLLTVMKISKK
jgi:hypothetical protein